MTIKMEAKSLLKILVLGLSIVAASCSSKVKESEEVAVSTPVIEDKSLEQNNYQEISSAAEAEALNAKAQKDLEEVEVQDRVLFSYDSFDLTPEAKEILKVQAEWLKSDKSIVVALEGHCDERGTREYNIALGEKRALSAKKFLVENGVEASRINVISFGKERPAFVGDSEEVLAKNRRAVTVVIQ